MMEFYEWAQTHPIQDPNVVQFRNGEIDDLRQATGVDLLQIPVDRVLFDRLLLLATFLQKRPQVLAADWFGEAVCKIINRQFDKFFNPENEVKN
jgi:hypothetical protein